MKALPARLAAALALALPAWACAQALPPASAATGAAGSAGAEAPLSGTLEVGLGSERSQFNAVHVDDAAVLLAQGRTRSTETYRHGAASLSAGTPRGDGLRCVANLGLDLRTGQRSHEADTGTAQADAGLQWRLAHATVGARVQAEQWRVAGRIFRRVSGLAADTALALDESLSAYALVNLAAYRHPGDGAALDARYRALTGNVRLAPAGPGGSTWTAQATLSREDNRLGDRALDNRGLLLRLAREAPLAADWELHASVIVQTLRFAAPDPLLQVRRTDRYAGLDLALVRQLSAGLQTRLEWNRSIFRSTAAVFDNDATAAGFKLAWSF